MNNITIGDNMKLGLSLAGGGIKGIAHIGCIKALEEENIEFKYISGTSSGSIVAVLYACGFTVEEMHDIFYRYAKSIHYIDWVNIKKFFINLFTGKGIKIDGLNSGTKIYKLVNEICKEKGISNINQINKPLIIPAVNILNEELYIFTNIKINKSNNINENIKYINNANIGKIVQASCSYPGIFSPCEYNNELLVDGGIAENLPWRETKKAGADKVLSIVFSDNKQKECCNNIIEVLSKSFSILCKELSKHEWDGTDYLLNIQTENVGLLEKSKMDELYMEGYNQTKNKIQDIKNKLSM